jgi:hypothetical protein
MKYLLLTISKAVQEEREKTAMENCWIPSIDNLNT